MTISPLLLADEMIGSSALTRAVVQPGGTVTPDNDEPAGQGVANGFADTPKILSPPDFLEKGVANGFAVAYVYGRSTEAEAIEAKQMTMDEARRVASNIAKLPDMLKREE
jgi:hypothetical protein